MQSILAVLPEGRPNCYLPLALALALNIAAVFLNMAQQRKNRKDEKTAD